MAPARHVSRLSLAGAIAALLLAWGAPQPAAGETAPPPPEPAVRCFGMIGLFDRIVQRRFDHRLLAIEAWQLADARRLRWQAEVDCARAEYWFGIKAIEDALIIIGVVPPTAFEDEVD